VKKIRGSLLSLLLAILMCFVLAACSGGEPSAEEGEDDYHYAAEDMIGSQFGDFTSVDMDGNEVSNEIFMDADVTVLNVWATFCGPCIEEMPDLAALAEKLPDNAQIIGVVIDTPPAGVKNDSSEVWGGDAENIELAKQICEETGVKYTNILASDSVMEMFANVEAVPTTFIVDREGVIVYEPFIGADVEGYEKAVHAFLEE